MIINESRLRSIIREEIIHSSTRLSLNESNLINEGAKETLRGLAQSATAAAVEYGIAAVTAGVGAAGPAQAAETAVDLAFSAKSMITTFESFDSMINGYKEIKALMDQSSSIGKVFAQSKDRYYAIIKKILRSIVKMAGGAAENIISRIKDQIQNLISRISGTIGDAVKSLIPDAATGLAAATFVTSALESLGNNCYDVFSNLVKRAGSSINNLFDPAVALKSFDDMYPKVIETIRTVAEKIDDPKLKALLIASTGGMALPTTLVWPRALKWAADTMEENKPTARRAVELIVKIAMPAIAALVAAMQMIMKGELAGPDKASKEAPEAPETKTESRRRSHLDDIEREISSIERDSKKLIVQRDDIEERGGYDIDRPAIPGGSGSHDDGYEIGSMYEDDDTFKKVRLSRLKASGVPAGKAKKMSGSKLKHRGKHPGHG
jgi:hypothetical protein